MPARRPHLHPDAGRGRRRRRHRRHRRLLRGRRSPGVARPGRAGRAGEPWRCAGARCGPSRPTSCSARSAGTRCTAAASRRPSPASCSGSSRRRDPSTTPATSATCAASWSTASSTRTRSPWRTWPATPPTPRRPGAHRGATQPLGGVRRRAAVRPGQRRRPPRRRRPRRAGSLSGVSLGLVVGQDRRRARRCVDRRAPRRRPPARPRSTGATCSGWRSPPASGSRWRCSSPALSFTDPALTSSAKIGILLASTVAGARLRLAAVASISRARPARRGAAGGAGAGSRGEVILTPDRGRRDRLGTVPAVRGRLQADGARARRHGPATIAVLLPLRRPAQGRPRPDRSVGALPRPDEEHAMNTLDPAASRSAEVLDITLVDWPAEEGRRRHLAAVGRRTSRRSWPGRPPSWAEPHPSLRCRSWTSTPALAGPAMGADPALACGNPRLAGLPAGPPRHQC